MQIRIKGYTFTLSEPFSAGVVITKGEAQALNALRAENIQNNLRELVNAELAVLGHGELIPAGKLVEIQSKLTSYDQGYQFVEKHSSKLRIGDIEVEARAIALERVEEQLRVAEHDPLVGEELDRQVAAMAGLPSVIEEARVRVAAKRRALNDGLADL